MQRRPLDGNARSPKPDTQLRENVVNEALIARVVCQPVQNLAARMLSHGNVFWRRVHFLLLSSDQDRRYRICRVRLDGVNRVYRVLFACITLLASCSCPAWENTAVARLTPPFNPQLAFDNSKGFLSNTVRFATLVSEGPSYQTKYLRSPHTIHNCDLPNSRRARRADRQGSAPARCPSCISQPRCPEIGRYQS